MACRYSNKGAAEMLDTLERVWKDPAKNVGHVMGENQSCHDWSIKLQLFLSMALSFTALQIGDAVGQALKVFDNPQIWNVSSFSSLFLRVFL